MKNGRLVTTIVGILTFFVGLAFGALTIQSNARASFVDQKQYQRDLGRIESKIDRLLKFHQDNP